jgi:hypothetical protein
VTRAPLLRAMAAQKAYDGAVSLGALAKPFLRRINFMSGLVCLLLVSLS